MYLNPDIQAAMTDGGRELQAISGETVVLDGVTYHCVPATELKGSLDFEEGGAVNMLNVIVNVLQADLRTAPAIDTLAEFRGNLLRVKSVDDTGIIWQILLVQQFG
jgi:hypothetical protein